MSLESRLFDAEKISAEILKIANSLAALTAAADKVGESLAGLHQENLGETYVAVVINGQSSNVTDTVTWSDIVDQPIIDKITTYDEYLESDEMARKRSVYTMASSDEEDN